MRKTLKEIAKLIDGELAGSGDTVITGASGIKEACPGDITFLANPKYLPLAEKTNASAIVAGKDVAGLDKPVIRVENPSLAFVKIVSCFSPQGLSHPKGIHKTAIISKSAKLGKNVSVGPYTVVEAKASIGDNTVIYSGCFIGQEVKIGKDSLIYPNVSIRERTSIGKNFIAHPGAVIGSDGFGFVTVEGRHRKIPQSGIVEIGDDVELGANVTIDRARFDKTRIGNGTKIDNLVHIAHNVIIGENCLIVAQAGISGSTTIGNNVTIAGQAGLVGHITVGDNAILAAQAGITKSVPANTMVSGYPAQPHDEAKRVNARIQNLSRLYKAVDELKKKVEELEKRLSEVK